MSVTKIVSSLGIAMLLATMSFAGLRTIANGSFNTGVASWGGDNSFQSWDTTTFHTAKGSLKLANGTIASNKKAAVTLFDSLGNSWPSYSITISMWIKTQDSAAGVTNTSNVHFNVGAYYGGSPWWAFVGLIPVIVTTGTTDWQKVEMTLTDIGNMTFANQTFSALWATKTGAIGTKLDVLAETKGGTMWIDDVEVTTAGGGVSVRFESRGNVIAGGHTGHHYGMTGMSVLDPMGRVVGNAQRPALARGIFFAKPAGEGVYKMPVMTK